MKSRRLNDKNGTRPSRRVVAMIALSLLLSCLTVSCECRPALDIDGGQPPTFALNCPGTLASFTVYEIIPKDDKSYEKGKLQFPIISNTVELWTIKLDPDSTEREWRRLIYGKVPLGMIQKYPSQGLPPDLLEGKFYGATATTIEPHDLNIAFSISKGKIIIQ